MSDNLRSGFAPRTVAAARARRTVAAKLLLITGFLRLKQWFLRFGEFALALQRRREVDELLHTDERLLKDIGLTRGDVEAIVAERRGWLVSDKMAKAAAARRNEAMAAADQRRTLVESRRSRASSRNDNVKSRVTAKASNLQWQPQDDAA